MRILFIQDGGWNDPALEGSGEPTDKPLIEHLAGVFGEATATWVPADNTWLLCATAPNWSVRRLGPIGPGGEQAYHIVHRFEPASETEHQVVRGLLQHLIGGLTLIECGQLADAT